MLTIIHFLDEDSAMDRWPEQKPNGHRAKLSLVLWREKGGIVVRSCLPQCEALGLFHGWMLCFSLHTQLCLRAKRKTYKRRMGLLDGKTTLFFLIYIFTPPKMHLCIIKYAFK